MKQGDSMSQAVVSAGGVYIARGIDGFMFRLPERVRVVVSWGAGWDHVSVSRENRCPTWAEMERVRKIVAAPGETWIQYGVPESDHINNHPYCLHWWRPQDSDVPRPPLWMV